MLAGMKIINYLDYRPKYDINKCVKSKSTKSACDKCYEACPHNAIKVYKRGIEITNDCNFCGICTSYCQSNAISDGGRKFCRKKDEIFVICPMQEKEDMKDKNLLVDCLKFFSVKTLMNLYIRGIRTIHVNRDKCGDCSYSHGIEEELSFTNEILKQLDKPPIIIREAEVDMIYNGLEAAEKVKSDKLLDRRNFFRELAKEVFSVGYDLAPPIVKEDGWKGLNEIIKELEGKESKGISLYKVNIDNSKCIGCNACVKLCPENVWQIREKELKTEMYNCNGCKLCADICPTQAIDIVKTVHKSKLKVEKEESKFCNICQQEFSTYLKEKLTCSKCISKEVFKPKRKK